MDSLIIVDEVNSEFSDKGLSVITFADYLKEYPKKDQGKVRVVNLCKTEKYLSRGYYCSLLAEARNHIVLPSVKTINEMRGKINILVTRKLCLDCEINWIESNESFEPVYIFLGESTEPALDKMSREIFKQFQTPVIKLEIAKESSVITLERVSIEELPEKFKGDFVKKLSNSNFAAWRKSTSKKKYRWDMAILVNSNESMPPSDTKAIEYFERAASKVWDKD